LKCDLSQEHSLLSQTDRAAHHKKVKQWFINPTKLCRELESEQKKQSDKCIYHLSKSHPTAACSVKKECDKILVDKKDSNGPTLLTSISGQL
jgi:hypothetical protein